MAHDLFFKRSIRNWSRGGKTPTKTPAVAVSGSTSLKKAALGTMALGTFAGLAFITSALVENPQNYPLSHDKTDLPENWHPHWQNHHGRDGEPDLLAESNLLRWS